MVEQRLGAPAQRSGNIGGSHTNGKRLAETALGGWAGRTRTCKRHFEKAIEMVGEFSLDYGTFWDQRLFAAELRRRGYAARRAYYDDLQQALPCGLGCVE